MIKISVVNEVGVGNVRRRRASYNRRDVDVMSKMESDKKVNNYAVYDGIIINHYINI
jgi:pyruvate kinase